jgi:hypothetical protein
MPEHTLVRTRSSAALNTEGASFPSRLVHTGSAMFLDADQPQPGVSVPTGQKQMIMYVVPAKPAGAAP